MTTSSYAGPCCGVLISAASHAASMRSAPSPGPRQGAFAAVHSLRPVTSVHASATPRSRRCECHDMFKELVPYVEAWRWQKSMVDSMAVGVAKGEDPLNALLILQHPPVYTMGTRSSDEYLLFDKQNPPFELHRTERGGEVTYHGPGQLVMYPILNLRHQEMDLHWYLRMLEEVVIRALWSSCGLNASRIDGLTGVWIGNVKVAAIGVRVSRWISYHGLALNVFTDLAPFHKIVPCGISDRTVGTVWQLLHDEEVMKVIDLSADNTSSRNMGTNSREDMSVSRLIRSQMWDEDTLLKNVHECLLQEFSEIFGVELVSPMTRGPMSSTELSSLSASVSTHLPSSPATPLT